MRVKLFCGLALIICINVPLANGERTKDNMYDQIDGVAACFRRLNATHQAGCSSDKDGSTGIVHIIENDADLRLILDGWSDGPYIPVMSVTFLTPSTVATLKSCKRIAGLVVYNNNETVLEQYSHDEKCPNRNYGLEDTCNMEWNKPGTGILNYDFSFPIFYVSKEEDVQTIRDCFNKFNNYSFSTQNERSLCSLELTSFMFATTDTPTCLRRSSPRFNLNTVKFCDPLGDENVWASLFPVGNFTNRFGNTTLTQKVKSNLKYIIVSARLDSTSLFHELVPGAINPVTGIVTLLTAAHLLKRMLPTYDGYDVNVLFVLLNGETYDYIGSQRLLYDMEHLKFPTKKFENSNESIPVIEPNNIALFVELSQLSLNNIIHLHVHNNSKQKPEIREFANKLQKYRDNIFIIENDGPLPPASLQTFIKSTPNISGVVLTSHGDEYTNKFYNSMYDNAEYLSFQYYRDNETIPKDSIQQHVANVSGIVAKCLYEEITKMTAPNLDLNVTLVNELFHCYLENTNCTIHQVIQKKKYKADPLSMYVGVSIAPNLITNLIGLTLGWLTADVVNKTGPCPGNTDSYVNHYFNMSKSMTDLNTTICYRTCMNFTEAVSPAFLIDDYDWKSNKYSSWSESIWREFNVRMFLKPSRSHENMTIAVGSMIMVLSFVLVYFIKSRSHILFPPPITIPPARC